MKAILALLASSLCLVFPAPAPEDPAVPVPLKITPFLWFDDDAEQALAFYASVFPDTTILSESRWGPGGPVPAGTLMTARFRLGGQEYMVLNAGPLYRLNEAFSLFVNCETQAELDELWTRLTADGGEPGQCGWLKDRFGVSWQVIPSCLGEMLADKDPARAGRVSRVMMSMGKLDIAKLKVAYDGR